MALLGEASASGSRSNGHAGQDNNGTTAKHANAEQSQDDDGDRDVAYFQYYSLLSHQAQMLQDSVRTSSYQRAILGNAQRCFRDKLVMDVGAGNGILSLFSAQAGAKRVYAIEASQMVERLKHLLGMPAASSSSHGTMASSTPVNAWIESRIVPVQAKMENVTADLLDGNVQVDTIVSECLGVLLVHERMCESFLDARDRFLKPGGTMLPSSGTICLAPIEDKLVWEEAANKARFWENQNFYGVDITPLAEAAWEESFSSPVVGCFGPLVVLAPSNDYTIDFNTISQDDLRCFTMPISFDIPQAAVVHGLAGWFDLQFLAQSPEDEAEAKDAEMALGIDGAANGAEDVNAAANTQLDLPWSGELGSMLGASGVPSFVPGAAHTSASSGSYMSTSPFATPTHWQQVRFLFREPLAVNKGQKMVGQMLCEVNNNRSYTLTASIGIDGASDAVSHRQCKWHLDRQVYSWTSSAPAPQ